MLRPLLSRTLSFETGQVLQKDMNNKLSMNSLITIQRGVLTWLAMNYEYTKVSNKLNKLRYCPIKCSDIISKAK